MSKELTMAAQQALEQLEFLNACYPHKTAADAIAALQSALTQRPAAQTEREADGLPLIVAGAIFDFAGFMTTRSEVIEVGSTAEAGPVADLVKEWAELRGLDLADAAVLSWQLHITRASLPAPQQATPASAPQSLLMRLAGIAAECSDPDTTDALDALIATTQQATPDQFADASKMVPPVALRSVRLTRDTAGMCVVRVNGRVAIRDNGDIIDHIATLEWFADTQQATPEPLTLGPLAKRNIYDAIRGAYDLGYNDARNARTVPGDSAPGYDGRSVEEDHGGALFNLLSKRLTPATPEPVFVIEVRECPDCGHIGINEWHPTDSACSHCDWTGPSPQEDKCPGCGTVGSMSSACPECGHKDTLIAHKHLPIPAATPPQQAAQATPEPVGEPAAWRWFNSNGDQVTNWLDFKAAQKANVEAQVAEAGGRIEYAYARPAPGVPEVK